MLFNSLHFLLFFPVVVVVYYATPPSFRWIWLLGSSYYFYMSWHPAYIILIVFSTMVDYLAGLGMGREKEKRGRRKYLWGSLAVNLGLLFLFKYYDFFHESLRLAASWFHLSYSAPSLGLLLPVGISFYTFQTLSYTIDVYRGNREPEKHLGYFALYVSFFPQLVAGPIERSETLLPQLRASHSFDARRVSRGLLLMTWGFFKKVVIADRVAQVVNTVYGRPGDFSGWQLTLATILFSYQLYCDFSGYSDIAIGGANVFGISLMENFRRPFLARSIAEFWTRWHISLSTWLRDYVSVPLLRTLRGLKKIYRYVLAIMLTFSLSGLWHGANGTFVIWGMIQGVYIVLGHLTTPFRKKLRAKCGIADHVWYLSAVQIVFTYALVCVAGIFFRAQSVADAWLVLKNLGTGWQVLVQGEKAKELLLSMGMNEFGFIVTMASIVFMEVVQYGQEKRWFSSPWLEARPIWFRWTAYYLLVLWILLFGAWGGQNFIYFQF